MEEVKNSVKGQAGNDKPWGLPEAKDSHCHKHECGNSFREEGTRGVGHGGKQEVEGGDDDQNDGVEAAVFVESDDGGE